MAAKKSAGNVTVTYNSNALTAYLDSQSLNAVVAELPTTNLASTGETKIAGLPDWSVDVGGPWDATLNGYLAPDAISPPTTLRDLVVVVDSATFTWTANSFISNFTITSSPSAPITWSGKLSVSGVPTLS